MVLFNYSEVSLKGARLMGGHGKNKGEYNVPRDRVDPPKELAELIFPWIEEEEKKVDTNLDNRVYETEIAAKQFLSLMKYMRTIIL